MSAMLYPFSVPHTQNTWDNSSPAPAVASRARYQLSSVCTQLAWDKIIVHINNLPAVTPAVFLAFPDILLNVPRDFLWWLSMSEAPSDHSLVTGLGIMSQISIVHSSLVSSVASRSLSLVKHSANIHNLVKFLQRSLNELHISSKEGIASISQLTNIFGLILSEKHLPHFLSTCLSTFLRTVGTQDRLCDHISGGISSPLITNAYLLYRNKISANVCILPSWYTGLRPFSHLFLWFEKILNNHARPK